MSNKHNQEWEDRLVQRGCLVHENCSDGQPSYTIVIPGGTRDEELEKIFELILDWHQDITDKMQEYHFEGEPS